MPKISTLSEYVSTMLTIAESQNRSLRAHPEGTVDPLHVEMMLRNALMFQVGMLSTLLFVLDHLEPPADDTPTKRPRLTVVRPPTDGAA